MSGRSVQRTCLYARPTRCCAVARNPGSSSPSSSALRALHGSSRARRCGQPATQLQHTSGEAARNRQAPSSATRGFSTAPPIQSTKLETMSITNMEAPHTGVVKIISLNRPAARNAISRQLLHELTDEIEAVHGEGAHGPTRALILASAVDESFCAGADLKERKTMSAQETQQFLSQLRHTFQRIQALPVPSIAAVTGTALGGGLELALCTHLRVFSTTALVGLPETRLAIIPGGGGTYRLPAVVGLSRAMDLVFTGKRIGAAQALEWGLCNYVAADGTAGEEEQQREKTPSDKAKAREAALELSVAVAMQIADGGPIALRAAVQAMSSRALNDEAENRAYETVLASQDRLEALKAFAEKRKPVFKGE